MLSLDGEYQITLATTLRLLRELSSGRTQKQAPFKAFLFVYYEIGEESSPTIGQSGNLIGHDVSMN